MKSCNQLCPWNTLYGCQKPESEPCILSNMACEKFEPKPQTNADHIRSMTDEELAHFKYGGGNPYCKEEEPTDCKRSKWVNGLSPCEQCYLDWLRKPCKEDT